MEPASGFWQPREDGYEQIRTPKGCTLRVAAPEFVPKQQHQQPQPHQHQHQQQHYSQQMSMGQPKTSALQLRMEQAAAGEPGGGAGGGSYSGGASYDYTGGHLGGHGGGPHNNGPMSNGNDQMKTSALVTRMNNLGLRDRQDTKQHEFHNSTQFNHHPQQQQQQQQHLQHQQHRYQQYQPQQPHHHQGSQAHHHHNHHGHSQSMQQQQMHQLPFGGSYGTSYSNAIHNQMNHPMFLAGGGNGGDNRKHNAAGGQHRSRQQQHHHHHQHHHHQQQQQHQHHHQQGPHHHHQSASSIGGGGGSGGMPMGGNGGGAEYVDDEQSSEHQSFALDYLTEVIAELYDNPGMFEDVKEKLSKMFSDFRNDRYVLSNAVEMIFEQSIKESNFRYMGARLCKLLDSLDENPESVLREMFQLKMEDQQNELKQMNHEQLKVRGTTLFLAELYMQFRNPHVQSTLTKDMAGRIFAAIEILLQKPGPENAKCVCQCLKLCGFELEQDCREDVLNILDKLRDLEKNVMHSVAPLISSVLKLHNNAWGRSEETVPVAPVPAVPDRMVGVMPLGADFSPVFYGPDGKVLSEEENSFLETNLHQAKKNAVFDDYEDDEDAYGVDDQDPEVQLAFENFVAETNRPNRQQHHH
ncbi:polyadenylate-binding protein-interacting protein 1-like isoform X3 [Anopheles darlingi]|uniref:polyadenylate-binding protein-interacting protein 1-like isoform X3 n=1 Tax=Anopheles darlingi TaxID=43151 RepID=UPI00210056FA|nr:polyadenylate-binding protein-interacting protein 1-like isoform X3 [Anopheles darlingi]